jgi:hypothetical protein
MYSKDTFIRIFCFVCKNVLQIDYKGQYWDDFKPTAKKSSSFNIDNTTL